MDVSLLVVELVVEELLLSLLELERVVEELLDVLAMLVRLVVPIVVDWSVVSTGPRVASVSAVMGCVVLAE